MTIALEQAIVSIIIIALLSAFLAQKFFGTQMLLGIIDAIVIALIGAWLMIQCH